MDQNYDETGSEVVEEECIKARRRQAQKDVDKAFGSILHRERRRYREDNTMDLTLFVESYRIPPPRKVPSKDVKAPPDPAPKYPILTKKLNRLLKEWSPIITYYDPMEQREMMTRFKFALRRPKMPTLVLVDIMESWNIHDAVNIWRSIAEEDGELSVNHAAEKSDPNLVQYKEANAVSNGKPLLPRLATAIGRLRRTGDDALFRVNLELGLKIKGVDWQFALEMGYDEKRDPYVAARAILDASELDTKAAIDSNEIAILSVERPRPTPIDSPRLVSTNSMWGIEMPVRQAQGLAKGFRLDPQKYGLGSPQSLIDRSPDTPKEIQPPKRRQLGFLEAITDIVGGSNKYTVLENLKSWYGNGRDASGAIPFDGRGFNESIKTVSAELHKSLKLGKIAKPKPGNDTEAANLLFCLRNRVKEDEETPFLPQNIARQVPWTSCGKAMLDEQSRRIEEARRMMYDDRFRFPMPLISASSRSISRLTLKGPSHDPVEDHLLSHLDRKVQREPLPLTTLVEGPVIPYNFPVDRKRLHSDSFETSPTKKSKPSDVRRSLQDPTSFAWLSTPGDSSSWTPETVTPSFTRTISPDTPEKAILEDEEFPKRLERSSPTPNLRSFWQAPFSPEEEEKKEREVYKDTRLPETRRRDFMNSTEGPGTTAALNRLFDQYRTNDDEADSIGVEGSIRYLNDIGVELDEVVVLAILTEISAPTMGEISRKGFVDGWRSTRAHTIDKQKVHAEQLRNTLPGSSLLRTTYRHTFQLALTPGQKSLALDAAIEYWRLLFASGQGLDWKTKSTPWFDWWLEFLETEKPIRGVSRDIWNQMWEFVQKTMADENLGWWSEDGAWPGVVDEFVAWVKKKRGE